MPTIAGEASRPSGAQRGHNQGPFSDRGERQTDWPATRARIVRQSNNAKYLGDTGLANAAAFSRTPVMDRLIGERARAELGALDRPGPDPGPSQRAPRHNGPPAAANDDWSTFIPGIDILERVVEGLSTKPKKDGDEGTAVPLAKDATNPIPGELPRRIAGADDAVEMAKREKLIEYQQFLAQQRTLQGG